MKNQKLFTTILSILVLLFSIFVFLQQCKREKEIKQYRHYVDSIFKVKEQEQLSRNYDTIIISKDKKTTLKTWHDDNGSYGGCILNKPDTLKTNNTLYAK